MHEQIQTLGGAEHFSIGVNLKQPFKASRMVLFGMLGDDVVDLLYAQSTQVAQQHTGHGFVHGVNKCRLLAALDQIGVVAGSFRQRN